MTKRKALLLGFIILLVVVGILFLPPSILSPIEPTPTPLPKITPTPKATLTAEPTIAAGERRFYVSPNGDDSNPGSESKPWRTLQYAVDQAIPGETILVKAGTYAESVHIVRAGLAERQTTLKSAGDGAVIIDGGGNPAINGEADYWTISDLELTSKSDRTFKTAGSYWKVQRNHITGAVYFWGNNNLFEENEVDGSRHYGNENGVMDDGPSSHHNVFRGNKIHDFKLRGIWSQWLTHDDTFEFNEISNITSETGMGIDLDAASNVGYRHTIRGNIIHDCAQTGIELENSYAALVENNYVYNTGLEGIQVINYQGCTAAGENNQYGKADGECRGDNLDTTIRQNLVVNGGRVGGIVSYFASGGKIYNNTVYASGAGLYILGDAKLASDWDVRGNIFANNSRVQISLDDPKSLSMDQNNLIYAVGGETLYEIRAHRSTFYTLAGWQVAFNLGQNSIEADPLFVDPQAGNFHLQVGSPAIDAGFNPGINMDFDNKPRLTGPQVDMGVYEH